MSMTFLDYFLNNAVKRKECVFDDKCSPWEAETAASAGPRSHRSAVDMNKTVRYGLTPGAL